MPMELSSSPATPDTSWANSVDTVSLNTLPGGFAAFANVVLMSLLVSCGMARFEMHVLSQNAKMSQSGLPLASRLSTRFFGSAWPAQSAAPGNSTSPSSATMVACPPLLDISNGGSGTDALSPNCCVATSPFDNWMTRGDGSFGS